MKNTWILIEEKFFSSSTYILATKQSKKWERNNNKKLNEWLRGSVEEEFSSSLEYERMTIYNKQTTANNS